MPPFINPPFDYPREPPTVIKGLLDNPTVTSNDKAIYVAGIIFTFLCLLLDIGLLAFIGYKTYRLCRRHRVGVVHGLEVVAGHEEKGILMDADEEEGGEQLPAYHDIINEDHNKENLSPITSNDNESARLPYGYLGPGDSYVITNIHGIKESITFPLTWYDLRDRGHVVQGLLHRFEIWAGQHPTTFPNDDNNEGTNKENVVPLNEEVVSPTSKAAHLSPHKNCTACAKLAQPNKICSGDANGTKESVTFPLTWDDMCEHGALIKWFLESHQPEGFKNTMFTDGVHRDAFHDDSEGTNEENVAPVISKADHLSPHEQCDYCTNLARPDKLSIIGVDGVEESVTFPLTWDDMFEHKALIKRYLDTPGGFGGANLSVERVTEKVVFA